jgi:hypothetical protein
MFLKKTTAEEIRYSIHAKSASALRKKGGHILHKSKSSRQTEERGQTE